MPRKKKTTTRKRRRTRKTTYGRNISLADPMSYFDKNFAYRPTSIQIHARQFPADFTNEDWQTFMKRKYDGVKTKTCYDIKQFPCPKKGICRDCVYDDDHENNVAGPGFGSKIGLRTQAINWRNFVY